MYVSINAFEKFSGQGGLCGVTYWPHGAKRLKGINI